MRRILLALLLALWAVPAFAQVQTPCLRLGTNSAACAGAGSPESVVYGNKGDLYVDTTNGTAYVKTTNTVNTGWSQLTTGTATGAPADAQYVTLATNGTLTVERVLTGTSNQITITDNGAGSTVVLSTPQNIHTAATPQFSALGLGGAAGSASTLKIYGTSSGSIVFNVPAAAGSNTLSFQAATDTIPGLATTDTFTNKRITPRVATPADATSVTPNTDSADYTYQANTQSAGTLTINADAGTPTNGQRWIFKLKSTNVQTFSWSSSANGYLGGTVALPTASTGSSKVDYYAFIFDSISGKWHYVGTAAGF